MPPRPTGCITSIREFRNRDGYAIEAQVGTVLDGLGFQEGGLDAPHRGVFRRLADAHRAGETAARKAQHAAARRAHQSPGSRSAQLAGTVSHQLSVRLRADFARPLFPGRHGQPHRRDLEQAGPVLQRQLRNVSAPERRAPRAARGRVQESARSHRATGSLHQPLPRYRRPRPSRCRSRIKELEKIERIEIPPDEQTIHFSFPQPKPSGRIVAEFKDVSKSYGAKHVFSGASFIIERGDRIALVGVNGAGKSTMIKLLAGTEPLTSGSYTLGHNVLPDYFAQDQYKELDPNARMLDDLSGAAPRSTQTELRTLLGCFLFSDDDVFKKIGVLVGRRAQSLRAGADAAGAVEFPAARRADQSPGHARQGRAARSAAQATPERWCSFRTTAISSTTWRRGSSKSRTATCTSIRAITRITCGARPAGRRRSHAERGRRAP